MKIYTVNLNVNSEGTHCQPFARVTDEDGITSVDILIVDEKSGGFAASAELAEGTDRDGIWRLPYAHELGTLKVYAEFNAFSADGSRMTKASAVQA